MGIKKLIKYLIVKLCRQIKRRKVICTSYPYKVLTSNKRQTFFGYYDKTPFSSDCNKILAMSVNCKNKPMNKPIRAEVGFFYTEQPKNFHVIGETFTWCWQQGCRLMWFPEDKNNLILYNKKVHNDYGSVVYSIKNNKTINVYNFPVYDLDEKGKFAISLNFSRLQRLRPGYGYINFRDSTNKDLHPVYDGIWLCSLMDNRKELIINLDQLSNFEADSTMKDAEHYVNHLCFNPVGDRFLFFHLWVKGGKKYKRAITSDLQGKNLKILNNEGTVSHYCWKSNSEILIFSSINKKKKYYLYKDLSNEVSTIGDGILNFDGHPTFFLDSKYILTDSYPDRFLRESSVMVFDSDEKKLNNIIDIFSPLSYISENRCDLHPRISLDSRYICIDFPTSMGRRMMIIDISGLISVDK